MIRSYPHLSKGPSNIENRTQEKNVLTWFLYPIDIPYPTFLTCRKVGFVLLQVTSQIVVLEAHEVHRMKGRGKLARKWFIFFLHSILFEVTLALGILCLLIFRIVAGFSCFIDRFQGG